MTIIDENILTSAGFTQEQSRIYLYLLEHGLANAKVISSKTSLGRPLTYKVLGQLISLGVVEKRDDLSKISLFFPIHPQKVKDLALSKMNDAQIAFDNLSRVFNSMSSSYNLLLGKPNVQFFDGIDGVKRVYEDILDIGKDIKVISSPIDENRTEILHLIREQIERQVANNIRTKAITPLKGQKIATPITEDEKYLITRKQLPADKLNIPAQIIIYGEKVAITNFKENIITVIIESKYIHETFSTLFEFVWGHE